MSEHAIQCAFFDWLKWQCGQHPELATAYAVPNGGLRSINTAKKLKAEGVKAGVPDVCLPFPRGGFAALYLEFKNGTKGSVTDAQRAMIELLRDNGNRVEVVRSVDQAIAVVREYLG